MITNSKSDLDFAYKGFQYPVPPSWKYAIRIQDQINWLLQAVLLLDSQGASVEEVSEQVAEAEKLLKDYTDNKNSITVAQMETMYEELSEQISHINAGLYYTRNPVRGFRDPIYVALKMMYDALRVDALTWDELDALGKTWDELKEDGHTWLELDLFSNIYYGDGQPRAKWTNPATIDDGVPGFAPEGVARLGRTWAEIADFGFLTIKD